MEAQKTFGMSKRGHETNQDDRVESGVVQIYALQIPVIPDKIAYTFDQETR